MIFAYRLFVPISRLWGLNYGLMLHSEINRPLVRHLEEASFQYDYKDENRLVLPILSDERLPAALANCIQRQTGAFSERLSED